MLLPLLSPMLNLAIAGPLTIYYSSESEHPIARILPVDIVFAFSRQSGSVFEVPSSGVRHVARRSVLATVGARSFWATNWATDRRAGARSRGSQMQVN